MSFVLTLASTVSCPHHGEVKPLVSQARLSVGRKPVLLRAGTLAPLVGCTVVTSGPNQQCLVATVTAGASTGLTVGGVAVLLDTLAGITDGAPPTLITGSPITAAANQSRLQAR